MAPNYQRKMTTVRKILVRDLNSSITCPLCRGYFVDATSLIDCLHVFCRACILSYFENSKLACPTCNMVYKKKSNPCFRSDPIIQSLVYKLIPGLYSKEVQRREDFYRSTGVRASSSCSEDSVLGDLSEEHEDWMLSTCGDQNQYLSPDDAISLSLEYYQPYLDTTQNQPSNTKSTNSQDCSETKSDEKPSGINNSANLSAEKTQNCDKSSNTNAGNENNDQTRENGKSVAEIEADEKDEVKTESANDFPGKKGERRYLQCPAAVTMSLLQKFLRMKYALSTEHRVDIIHSGEVLPSYFSLMDVAYTFKWERTKPMRFFYRIFTPAKIQPIRIISTPSLGGKQLQVVPAKPNPTQTLHATEPPSESTKDAALKADSDAQNYRNKERLMANLELQSNTKVVEKSECSSWQKEDKKKSVERVKASREPEEEAVCVYEYEEPDKDEIRAFAEKRDREWALQKQLDEEKEKHRTSKKRKKSKHSKGNLLYKKRKLHAEITPSEEKEESLKLKVKITPHNGYKHKHHKSSQNQVVETAKQLELSSKEKLLQMRQVRHKHIAVEDKTKTSYQNNNTSVPNNAEESIAKPTVKCKEEPKRLEAGKSDKTENTNKPMKTIETSVKTMEVGRKLQEPRKPQELSRKSQDPPTAPAKALQSSSRTPENTKPCSKEPVSGGKTLRSDFTIKTNATKELCMQKYPTVQLERNEQTERQAQKTFLKTFQSYTENSEKPPQPPKSRPAAQNTYPGRNPHHSNLQTTKSLEQKIANLHQQCTTVEAKLAVQQDAAKIERKVNEKPQILNSQYPSGFTVSKIEAGAKRQMERDHAQDKRPSLEITLINPTPVEKQNSGPELKPVAKRPPPPTIPLERIKKSMNRISGISITAKLDRCDNSGALDLSKPSRSADIVPNTSEMHNKILNGLSFLARPPERVRTPDKNIQLSNLQMLSKVALEHPNINKNTSITINKRPQMPNLQTLKIPVVSQNSSSPKPNLPKLPKLNEISKAQFRMPNPQMRNMRPHQNQSVRNIPNPSLLVRQQNQNRLNSLHCSQTGSDSKEQSVKQNSSSDVTNVPKNEGKEKSAKEEKDQNKASVEKKAGS